MAIVPITQGIDERVIIVDGTGSPVGTVGSPLFVSVSGAGAGGTSAIDEAPWTAGVSGFNPIGGAFNDSAAALTSGQQGQSRVTPNRALHVNLRNQAGAEITSFGGVSVVDAAGWTTASSVFVPGGGVFNDSAAALTSGQQGTGRVTPNRALHVNLRNQAGSEITAFGLSVVDAAAWTTAVSSFTPGGAVFNDSAAALTSGQQGTLRSTPNRGLHANLRSQNGTELFPVPAALAAATANPTLSQISTYGMVFNGTTWDPVRDLTGATNGTVGVPAAGMVIFDTVDVQNKRVNSAASAVAGGVTGKNAAALAPLKYTVAHGSAPTNFAAGVFAAPIMTRNGVAFVAAGHPNNSTTTVDFSGAQTNAVVIANTAGTKLIISSFLVYASAANTVNTPITLGLAQTVTPATGVAGRVGAGTVPAGGGFGRKTYQAGADGDQLLVTSTGAGAFSVQVEWHTTPT